MGGKIREACGRCSMTSVVDVASGDGEGDDDGNERNPFDGARIEVPESQLRLVSAPTVVLGRIKGKVDEVATRLTYGEV